MSTFKLLIVEDNETDLGICRDAIDIYEHKNQREIRLVECKNLKEALSKLDSSIDGAIIDLKLEGEGHEGNEVISKNEELHLRIPAAILTGTPDEADLNFANIGVFKKGSPEARYADLLERLWKIRDTGLNRIMGGRGLIENTMNEVFRNNLLPQIDEWVSYGTTDTVRTERALLRHTLNHLLQLLNDDEDRHYPEEFYLHPPLTEEIRTGSLAKKKNEDKWFVVMNPSCDLVVRENGSTNTDRILIVEVEPIDVLFPWFSKETLTKSKKGALETAFQNNKSGYYHWLPETDFFKGGFLNFRKLSSLEIEEFRGDFETSEIQISPSFVKDIVARFSSYYARQGQPDIHFDKFINP